MYLVYEYILYMNVLKVDIFFLRIMYILYIYEYTQS
jgi:hypothetical protein